MKHAYLIMAHNEPEILSRLIALLDSPDNDIYVHIDKKANLDVFKLSSVHCDYSKLYVLSNRLDVRWSGYSQIACEMLLMETAYHRKKYDYFHIMSGTTLPIKSIQYIHDFYERNKGTVFLGIDIGDVEKTIADRIRFRYLFIDRPLCLLNSNIASHLNGLSVRVQKALRIVRESSFPLKIGPNWCSLTPECVEMFLSSKKWIEKTFKYGYCVDELYKQTLIWNSPLRDKLYKVGNGLVGCLYEIDWHRGSVHSPYTFCQESDVDMLLKSDRLFARKFSYKYIEVVDKLIEKVHK